MGQVDRIMETGLILSGILAALVGIVIAAVISLIPGLHIYNVIAITMVFYFAAMETFTTLDPLTMTCFLLGMVVAFSMLFTSWKIRMRYLFVCFS